MVDSARSECVAVSAVALSAVLGEREAALSASSCYTGANKKAVTGRTLPRDRSVLVPRDK